jgi:hypothetical protein
MSLVTPPNSNGWNIPLKVPKCEIFDPSDFPDFYTIKSSWLGNLVVKILTYYFTVDAESIDW